MKLIAPFLIVVALGFGQIPRDTPGVFATGGGSIAGVIRSERDGRPMRRVNVLLSGGAVGAPRAATTDENGRFAFRSLPFGQYLVSATRPGFVPTFYGSHRPGRGPGQPITLAAHAASANIAFTMPNGAVITGTVTDANGRPAQNVRLTLMQYRMSVGQRQLVAASMFGVSTLNTDDRGVYRVYGLSAGEYLIAAVPQPGDIRLMTDADIQRAQQQVQQAASGAAGSAAVRPGAAPIQTPVPAVPSPSVGYARIFYPGTPDPAGAVPITLRSGEERSGVDFSLQFVRTARIGATILDSSGQPVAQPQISLTQPGVPATLGSWSLTRHPSGRFEAAGVPPGQYVIEVRLTTSPPAGRAAAAAETLWAAADVRVDGEDLTGLTLQLRPAMVGSGRVTFDSPAGAAPPNPSAVRVTLLPIVAAPGPNPIASPQPFSTTNADGSLMLRGILPGTYRFAVNYAAAAGGPSWIAKSITMGSRDVTDRVVEIKPDDNLGDIVVTMTSQPAEIGGKLLDAAGQPATGLTVMLFTADRTFWGLQSRRTTLARPAPNGEFRFPGLLPGEYYISAVTDFDANETGDPTFYEALVPASLKITVGAGERKVQDLRLATQ